MRTAGAAELASAAVQDARDVRPRPEVVAWTVHPADGVGRGRPVIAATTICCVGELLSDRSCAATVATGISMPWSSADTHPSSVTHVAGVPAGRQPRRPGAVAEVAELVAAEVAGRAERRFEGRVRRGVEQRRAGGAEQSSSSVTITMNRIGLGPQEPLVLRRRRAAVGAERARDGGELVLEAAAGFAEGRDAAEHVFEIAGVVLDAVDVGDEGGARHRGRSSCRTRARCTGRCRSCRRSRRSPPIDPSPAPMSVLMTPM